MRLFNSRLLLLPSAVLAATTSLAATQLAPLGDSLILSDGSGDQTPDLNSAAKVKLVRLSTSDTATHGRLISVFGDGIGNDVYDVKGDAERPARDVFVRYSDDDGVNWTPAVNVSNTAALTSMSTEWQGEDTGDNPYYGDSDKPNIFNSGNKVVITWTDKYCLGGVQGSVTYVERDMREIPYSCTYAVRSSDGGASWGAAEQLSDGSRDAKQDANKGTSAGWVITWQEDPLGLQLGEADGPGDGASGAKVSHGTDIWYSYVANANFGSGAFSAPQRVTNNWTKMDKDDFESGKEGASRANIGMVGSTVIVAYEETKGTEGIDEGKYVRYHAFPMTQPPSTATEACLTSVPGGVPTACDSAGLLPPNPDTPERAGCILSHPEKNARRVRFLTQSAGGNSGTKLFIFWKEGDYSQGGPSDIMARYASDFLDLSTFTPAINTPTTGVMDGCLIRGDDEAVAVAEQGAYANTQSLNLSHDTPNGGDLTADPDANSLENALAHRGYIDGDTIVLGYSYSPDGVLATVTDMENYNFWIRRSLDGGATWTPAVDLTSASIVRYMNEHPEYDSVTQLTVKEPRIVKAPGSSALYCPNGDPDDSATTDATECQASGGFVVAWGLIENTYEHIGGGKELDLFITRSMDGGETYERPVIFAGTASDEFESQIRMTPALDKVFTVWNSTDADSNKDSYYMSLAAEEVADEDNSSIRAKGKGGYTTPFMLMLLGAVGVFLRRRMRS